jgi:hypothetical protein
MDFGRDKSLRPWAQMRSRVLSCLIQNQYVAWLQIPVLFCAGKLPTRASAPQPGDRGLCSSLPLPLLLLLLWLWSSAPTSKAMGQKPARRAVAITIT